MNLELEDKVVWITGASGGIGRATAEAFAAEGALVALHGHRQWEQLVDWIAQQEWSERALAVRANVTSPAEVDAAAKQVCERFGRIDVTVANAGIWPPEERNLWELTEARIREVLDVNLFGALWTARAFMQCLARTGPRADGHGASLIFTGSTAGHFGERGHADYAASKAGLTGLMMTLKNEIVLLDRYARVNVVEPGWTVTEMARRSIQEPGVVERVVQTMPVRQLGRARDIARTTAFLASPSAARHISGQVITVAGGMEGRILWEQDQVDGDQVRQRLTTD
ncbi:MAG: 3-oxoacyl-[acyl-carrier protein] reductase [Chlamydiales bacterium]|jgi:3-oxoacyl-[acyl-carrier protein] reductase